MPKIDPDKKKEYNQKYRNKKKSIEVEILEQPTEKIEEIQEIEEPKVEIKPVEEEPKEKTYELDEETYNYLIENLKKNTIKEEEKKEEKKEPSFFLLMKNQMKQQLIVSCATIVPIIAGKLIINGMTSLGSNWKLPTLNYTQNTKPKPSNTEEQPFNLSELRPMNY